jgi:hypothetical protein
MRVYVVVPWLVAVGLKVAVISGAGIVLLFLRVDDDSEAARSFILNLAWISAVVFVGVFVQTPIWLRKRRPAPLPAGARIVSFTEVLRPDKVDLVALLVIVGMSFVFPAEDAAYYVALYLAGALASGLNALVFRALERRRGLVLLRKAGWAWFPPLYSASAAVLPHSWATAANAKADAQQQ